MQRRPNAFIIISVRPCCRKLRGITRAMILFHVWWQGLESNVEHTMRGESISSIVIHDTVMLPTSVDIRGRYRYLFQGAGASIAVAKQTGTSTHRKEPRPRQKSGRKIVDHGPSPCIVSTAGLREGIARTMRNNEKDEGRSRMKGIMLYRPSRQRRRCRKENMGRWLINVHDFNKDV